MKYWADQVKSGDTENHEGRAAAYYWGELFDAPVNFRRDPDGSFPNNLLNYGYAILRAVVARSLAGSGLLTTLGIHHHNRYNAYCLADDIMEPYRPYVDRMVLQMMNKADLTVDLNREQKSKLLQVPVLEVNINGRRSPLMLATQQSAASLARCFAGEQRRIDFPDMNKSAYGTIQ
jgi:CRISPR-associated protein Cas1